MSYVTQIHLTPDIQKSFGCTRSNPSCILISEFISDFAKPLYYITNYSGAVGWVWLESHKATKTPQPKHQKPDKQVNSKEKSAVIKPAKSPNTNMYM